MKHQLFVKMGLALVCAMLPLAASQLKAQNLPVLTIEGGQVQGVKTDIDGVVVYRGIPYAAPPINELRWKAPQPVVPWKGVKVCRVFGHPGYQANHLPGGYATEWGYGEEAPYSEDCLYLNVWTTASGQTNKKLPVALWIHGGGYREGWGSEPEFDAQEWAAKGVVLVSINYRLGVFGFLVHPLLAAESPQHVSGNYGILDQIESLKWIKKNIAQFGGDPDNVMIFGQSAGGGSVRTLCESPLARGLFHKAVIMSAGGLPTSSQPTMRMGFSPASLESVGETNKKMFDWAGLKTLEQMRRASSETVYALSTLYGQVTGERAFASYSPMVDGYVSKESFDDAAINGRLADVPYMIGYTLNDMGDMAAGIQEFCFNREKLGNKGYAYEFARPLPDDGSHPEVTARLKGAFHSSDLWFVFKSLKHCWRPWTKGDWDLSEKMLTAWTNFAKYSDPNGAKPGKWTPCTKSNPNLMLFKLNDADAEASEMGAPIKDPNGMGMFGGMGGFGGGMPRPAGAPAPTR
ncbi:MAG: carboxylesterase family protein [Bacteroidaceae bacterium]|nr:carboxylesterase family protein [Bacteroidaceae bacterium]